MILYADGCYFGANLLAPFYFLHLCKKQKKRGRTTSGSSLSDRVFERNPIPKSKSNIGIAPKEPMLYPMIIKQFQMGGKVLS